LLAYNDAAANTVLPKGQVIYLEKKKRKAQKWQPIHIADKGETWWEISQRYAVRLASLRAYNALPAAAEPAEGQAVYLRAKR
jgi:LysM repeat protein